MTTRWVGKKCQSCGAEHGGQEAETICDNGKCNRVIEDDTAVRVKFSYPSLKDGENLDFCSDQCFLDWMLMQPHPGSMTLTQTDVKLMDEILNEKKER